MWFLWLIAGVSALIVLNPKPGPTDAGGWNPTKDPPKPDPGSGPREPLPECAPPPPKVRVTVPWKCKPVKGVMGSALPEHTFKRQSVSIFRVPTGKAMLVVIEVEFIERRRPMYDQRDAQWSTFEETSQRWKISGRIANDGTGAGYLEDPKSHRIPNSPGRIDDGDRKAWDDLALDVKPVLSDSGWFGFEWIVAPRIAHWTDEKFEYVGRLEGTLWTDVLAKLNDAGGWSAT